MSFSENIKEVVELLSMSFEEEIIRDNQEAFTKLQELYEKDSDNFLEMIQFAQSDFTTLVKNTMVITDFKNESILEHIISGLYKHFHTKRIERLEGMSCSYDKSSYIESMTMKALKANRNYSLYADYTNVDRIKEDKEKQAYWSPITVEDTDEAIKLFWNWYNLDF